jgi:UDP-2,4-diacetamido-2,4,6-trideoxy-beta-L-altropyranose hydrolase
MALGCRRATMADADLLWRWVNDPLARANSLAGMPIPYPVHVAWLKRRLGSEATKIWIFGDGQVPVGQVRFDRAGDAATISISVATEHRGRGFGRAMLTEALQKMSGEWGPALRPRAIVLDRNPVSLALFAACGFRKVGRVERGAGRGAVVLEGTQRAKPTKATRGT